MAAEHLVAEAAGDDDRVAAAAVEDGHGRRAFGLVGFDDGADEAGRAGLVDVRDDDGGGIAVDGAGADADGAGAAAEVERVEHRAAGEALHRALDFVGAITEDDDDFVDAGFLELVDLVSEEGFAAPIEQRFRLTHAGRHARGEDDAGDHKEEPAPSP